MTQRICLSSVHKHFFHLRPHLLLGVTGLQALWLRFWLAYFMFQRSCFLFLKLHGPTHYSGRTYRTLLVGLSTNFLRVWLLFRKIRNSFYLWRIVACVVISCRAYVRSLLRILLRFPIIYFRTVLGNYWLGTVGGQFLIRIVWFVILFFLFTLSSLP